MIKFTYPFGTTPLDADEAVGLIPQHISTQEDLNLWEEANIVHGERWAFRQKRQDILDEGFMRQLHKKMFEKTWRWAGTFRMSNKNIGVDWPQVPIRVRNLLDNTRYQIDHQVFAPDELAIRFHHQLVWIHAFSNGNGRHARFMADVLAITLGMRRFTWGSASSLVKNGGIRTQYLQALRAADQGQLALLLHFAKS